VPTSSPIVQEPIVKNVSYLTTYKPLPIVSPLPDPVIQPEPTPITVPSPVVSPIPTYSPALDPLPLPPPPPRPTVKTPILAPVTAPVPMPVIAPVHAPVTVSPSPVVIDDIGSDIPVDSVLMKDPAVSPASVVPSKASPTIMRTIAPGSISKSSVPMFKPKSASVSKARAIDWFSDNKIFAIAAVASITAGYYYWGRK